MLAVKVFNQRDPKWANDRHGTSNSTIGKTGCTICVIASMLDHAGYDIDPKRLNVMLTQNGGYSQGNLVIWQTIPKLFPKVKWVYRHYSYNNALASEWIKVKGILPIIEVGAAPIGGAPGGKHWVGFVGDMKSIDPWIGQIRDTSTWVPTGMALYDYKPGATKEGSMADMYGTPHQYDLNNRESMKIAVDHLNEILEGKFVRVEEKKELEEQLGREQEFSKRLVTNIEAIKSVLNLPKDTPLDTVVATVKSLKDSPTTPVNPSQPPKEIIIHGEKWALNGVEWSKDGLLGNYKRL